MGRSWTLIGFIHHKAFCNINYSKPLSMNWAFCIMVMSLLSLPGFTLQSERVLGRCAPLMLDYLQDKSGYHGYHRHNVRLMLGEFHQGWVGL